MAVLELLTIKIEQMTIESTNDNNNTKPAITYSECYQQCFCSDNLELMKTIESNTIDLIYCDILYGTGKNFGDYQDLKPIRSEIENHYIPRIKEMHRILKQTGSIFLQMDCKINHWIRCILDDIFGYDNFRNEIVWKRGTVKGAKAKGNQFARNHDVIFYFSKSNEYIFNRLYLPFSAEYIKRFNKDDNDGKGPYRDDQAIGTRSETSIKEMIDVNKIIVNQDGSLKIKTYLNELEGVVIDDNWIDISEVNVMSNQRTDYPTQKPKSLIERIIKASSNEGDLVADFYMGSGTTAEVCKDLKRNFIGCDINPRAVEITLKRLNNARS